MPQSNFSKFPDSIDLELESGLRTEKKNNIVNISDWIRCKSDAIISNRFLGIDFWKNISIKTFIVNMDLFLENILLQPIENVEELYEVKKLIKDMHLYIMINRDSILHLDWSILIGIKTDYMRIHDVINEIWNNFHEKGNISLLTNISINQIDNIFKNLNDSFKWHYYLFVPPTSREIPKSINPTNIIVNLKNNDKFYIGLDDFKVVYDDLKLICSKIINNDENVLWGLDLPQLLQLNVGIDYIIEEINKVLDESEEKWLTDMQKNRLLLTSNLFLNRAKWKIKQKLWKREFVPKILEYKNTLPLNINISELVSSNELFSDFINNFREFKKHLFLNEDILWEFDESLLLELKEILIIVKNILNEIIQLYENWLESGDVSKTNSKKIIYNTQKTLWYILWFNERNQLLV